MMAFIANPEINNKLWDYIHGEENLGMSISLSRWEFLSELDSEEENNLRISLRDPETNKWTKWAHFPGMLVESIKDGYGGISYSGLTAAIDVHRSMLPNEIVIESDYPTYEENYEAARLIGEILEKKGFEPLYYYSGNKSIHIHIFLDWRFNLLVDDLIIDQLKANFNGSEVMFKKHFIKWLRKKMISCWDTNVKKFDEDLINASHLIRCEISRNKKGFKTFLGYTYKDLSFIPYICNEENRIYPEVGKIKLSLPNNSNELMEEYLENLKINKRLSKLSQKNSSLSNWVGKTTENMRKCTEAMLHDDFKEVGDGFHRAMFILVNELRRVHGDNLAKIIIKDWNEKMGSPISESDIDYRFRSKNYTLTCTYIHKFLDSLNPEIAKKCHNKVYK